MAVIGSNKNIIFIIVLIIGNLIDNLCIQYDTPYIILVK